jgi:hypothetical protein
MRLSAACLVACCLVLPVWGSEPGEPLDCSDWVFVEPGFACDEALQFPCDSSRLFWVGGATSGADSHPGSSGKADESSASPFHRFILDRRDANSRE